MEQYYKSCYYGVLPVKKALLSCILTFLGLLIIAQILGCGIAEKEGDWDSGFEIGAVAASDVKAVEVGKQILEEGGNAIDAAIAVSFALNVAEPQGSGIGGGGFMLVLPADDEPVFIDYRERAPAASTAYMYEADPSLMHFGSMSVAVPGQLRGMEKAHELFGTLEMAELIEPAVTLGQKGVPVTPILANLTFERHSQISNCDEMAATYLHEGLFPYEEGQIFKQLNLANTLSDLAEKGFDHFYRGDLAEKIVEAVGTQGGIITLEDLDSYEVHVTTPLKGSFGDFDVLTSPLPSSGGILLLQLLNIWKHYPYETGIIPDSNEIAYLARAMNLVFDDREKYIGDPNFVNVPLDDLISEEYFQEKSSQIISEYLQNDSALQEEGASTTSFATADAMGNIVVVTQTINFFFGAMMAVPDTGIILNNQMRNFSSDPNSLNAPEAGKTPVSSMVPTIFLRDGKPVMALCSPGARRLITAIGQSSINYLKRGLSLQEAIDAPRFHYQGHLLHIEPGYEAQEVENLKQEFVLSEYNDYNLYFGRVAALAWEDDGPVAHADHRSDGTTFLK